MITFDHIEVKQDSYQQLVNLLKYETGFNLEYYRKDFIIRRIKARMIRVNCFTLDSYYNYIISNKEEEIKKFIASFTINYSSFFRNWEVFDLFQTLFLNGLEVDKRSILSDLRPTLRPNYPLLTKKKKRSNSKNGKDKKRSPNQRKKFTTPQPLKRYYSQSELSYFKLTTLYQKLKYKSQRPINIWSCPCATGEEPYSIAMIFDNLKKQISNFPNYFIVASDIDKGAISKARKGIYIEESMKEVSNYYEHNYFTRTSDYIGYKYAIKDEIKREINFIVEDITKEHKKNLRYDIIFCRYLLIYFNRENRNKFLKILESRLNYGGLLIIGKTETLFKAECNLRLVDSRNHVYLKSTSNFI
jgi:chemotaxis methyl-accepting protein methylase